MFQFQIKVQIERLEQNSKESINYLKANISAESNQVHTYMLRSVL